MNSISTKRNRSTSESNTINTKNGFQNSEKKIKLNITNQIIFEKIWKNWKSIIELPQNYQNGNVKLDSNFKNNTLKFDKSFITYFNEYYQEISGFNINDLPKPLSWLYVFINLKSDIFNTPIMEYTTIFNYIKQLFRDDIQLSCCVIELLNNNNGNNSLKYLDVLTYNSLYEDEIEHLSISLFFLHKSIHSSISVPQKIKMYKLDEKLQLDDSSIDFTVTFIWHSDVVNNFKSSFLNKNNKMLTMYKKFTTNLNYLEEQISKANKFEKYSNIDINRNYILSHCNTDLGFIIHDDEILIDRHRIIQKLRSNFKPLDYSFFAFHSPFLLFIYVYLTVKYSFFQIKSERFNEICDLLIKHDIVISTYSVEFTKHKSILFLIIDILNSLSNVSKIYTINKISYPWNNAIIPAIGKLLVENKKTFTSCVRYVDIYNHDENSFDSFDEQPEPQQMQRYKNIGLLDYHPNIENISWDYIKGNTSQLVNKNDELTDTFIKDWVNRTHNHAIFISGTACVGKSTFLENVNLNIKKNYNECATIMKSGRCGGFDGKDEDLIMALILQASMINYGLSYINCVGDRTPYDNLLWRFIMALVQFDNDKDIVSSFVTSFSKFPPTLLALIGREPFIFFINSNVTYIRDMMKKRGKGNDSWRADVHKYVEIQNMVYGVFASLTKCLIFDLADYDNKIPSNIEKLINEKCKRNNSITGKITVDDSDDIYKVDIGPFKSIIPQCNEDYRCAKVLNIFK